MKKFYLLEKGDEMKIGDEILVKGNVDLIWSKLDKIPDKIFNYNKGIIARREISPQDVQS